MFLSSFFHQKTIWPFVSMPYGLQEENAGVCTHLCIQHNIISFFWVPEGTGLQRYLWTVQRQQECRQQFFLLFRKAKHNQLHKLEDVHLQTISLCLQTRSSQSNHWRQNFQCLGIVRAKKKKKKKIYCLRSIIHSNLWNLYYNYTKILNSESLKSQLLIESVPLSHNQNS